MCSKSLFPCNNYCLQVMSLKNTVFHSHTFSADCYMCFSVRVVFKWLMRAFSGHLPPEQLLYLWDMILAYDSLEVLPLLAVAIISFRKDNLLLVDTLHNVEVWQADRCCRL